MLGIFFLTYYPTISPLKTGSSLIDGLTDERLLVGLWAVRLPLLVMFTLAATAMLAWLSLAEVQTTTAKDLSLLAWTAVFGIATLLVSPSPPVLTYLIAHQYQLLFLTLLAPASLYLKARRDTRGILAAGALAISFIAISSLDTSNLYENLAQALSGKRAVRWTLWMLSEIPMFSALFFTAGCVVWVTTRRAKATQELRLNFLSAASAVLLLTHVSMISSDNVREYSTLLRDPTRTFSFFAAHPDNATSDVGRFIRESTPNDVVISSNSFCCLGTDWLADEVKSLSAFESLTTHPSYGWTSWGGFNYALASVSRRQFLLAGPHYLVTRDTAGLVSRRLEASVLYGATGSNSHLGILRADGADYFVVDKAALGDLAVPTFEERTIFENSRYLVLDLAS